MTYGGIPTSLHIPTPIVHLPSSSAPHPWLDGPFLLKTILWYTPAYSYPHFISMQTAFHFWSSLRHLPFALNYHFHAWDKFMVYLVYCAVTNFPYLPGKVTEVAFPPCFHQKQISRNTVLYMRFYLSSDESFKFIFCLPNAIGYLLAFWETAVIRIRIKFTACVPKKKVQTAPNLRSSFTKVEKQDFNRKQACKLDTRPLS